jgi:predicted regulator of Ras-like GTPase activity (Roadblock/LC7/MglB family)
MSRSTTTDNKREAILREIISELENQKGVKGWAVISQEGLIIDHKMPVSVNPHLLAGNAAALAHSAQVVVHQTESGNMNAMVLEGDKNLVMVVGGEKQLIFLVLAEHETNLPPLAEFLSRSAARFSA